jgi:hypothetical protein
MKYIDEVFFVDFVFSPKLLFRQTLRTIRDLIISTSMSSVAGVPAGIVIPGPNTVSMGI